MRRKEHIVAEIAALAGVAVPPMSTGSTEPKSIFLAINSQFGLGLDIRLSKPELARAIVESSGSRWAPDCESRGATVTTEGLVRVLRAVRFFAS
jgi:hypothetical protein